MANSVLLKTGSAKIPFSTEEYEKEYSDLVTLFKTCASQRLEETHLNKVEADQFYHSTENKFYTTALLWNFYGFPKRIITMMDGEEDINDLTENVQECLAQLLEEEDSKEVLFLRKNLLKEPGSQEFSSLAEEDSSFITPKGSPKGKEPRKEEIKSRPMAEILSENKKKEEDALKKRTSEFRQKCDEVEQFIRSTYSVLIAEQTLEEKEIQALVFVLARVNCEVNEIPKTRTPSRLFDWGTVRSSITMPYLSLKQAADNAKFDKNFGLQTTWGYVDSKFKLPTKESLDDDDTFWGKIADLLKIMRADFSFNASIDETVPDLSQTKLAKNNYFGYVFIRLVELMKSPASATIRSGNLSALDQAKNDVDYVILSLIYERDKKKYNKLPLSPELNKLQRVIRQTRDVVEKKNKIRQEVINTYQGFALSEKLSYYLDSRIAKSPEGEPFFRFVFEIINMISKRIGEQYVMPKSYFSSPNIVIRKSLRRGPDIKLKNETRKGNTYVPFSFAKSSECESMPETIRKSLTGLGSVVSRTIDSINNKDILEQNLLIDDTLSFVKLCYSVSDELRKQWQQEAVIIADLELLVKDYSINFLDLSEEERSMYIYNLSQSSINTRPVYEDATKQAELKSSVSSIVEQKKKQRRKTASS